MGILFYALEIGFFVEPTEKYALFYLILKDICLQALDRFLHVQRCL